MRGWLAAKIQRKSTDINNQVNILLLLLLCTHSKFISLSIYQFSVIRAFCQWPALAGNCFALHNVCNDFCFYSAGRFYFLIQCTDYGRVCARDEEREKTRKESHTVSLFPMLSLFMCCEFVDGEGEWIPTHHHIGIDSQNLNNWNSWLNANAMPYQVVHMSHTPTPGTHTLGHPENLYHRHFPFVLRAIIIRVMNLPKWLLFSNE